MKILYVCPAWSDQASRCRMYYKDSDVKLDAHKDYKQNPDSWIFFGLMNSQGKLVCSDLSKEINQEIRDHEPLMGGMQINVP
jgi:hypothetical protein